MYTLSEPVYALATAFSPSALAVIRASGEGSLSLLAPFFEGRLGGRVCHGFITDGERRLDEAVVITYRQGHGYTAEEAFEIMCHGSLPVIKAVSRALEKAGFREALPGEFTYRAFMHGRMDLTEAEAVEELVSSRSERSSSDALSRLTGSLRREAEQVKDRILDILAQVEVQLDYGEDDIPEEWVFPSGEADEIKQRLRDIAGTYSASRLYSQGAVVVLAGHTNAGKSSLFNALLKEDRAIVSSMEGTTRDYLEAAALIGGMPVRLFDTAGLRDVPGEIEREGIRRTHELMQRADLVVYVLDGDEPKGTDDDVLYVRSKRDLTGNTESLSFSSLTGEGLEGVLDAIKQRLEAKTRSREDVPRIDSERQRDKLLEAAEALEEAEKAKDAGCDIVALYLQASLGALAALVGQVTSEDVLDRLFSSFCLGK